MTPPDLIKKVEGLDGDGEPRWIRCYRCYGNGQRILYGGFTVQCDRCFGTGWFGLRALEARDKGDGNTTYVRACIDGRWVYLHRLLLKPAEGMVADHLDGNGLNNTRSNLRAVPHHVNIWNAHPGRSDYGVTFKNGKWRARMRYNGKRLELGFYVVKEDAVRAYDTAVSILRDSQAYTNGSDVVAATSTFPPTARRILVEACR